MAFNNFLEGVATQLINTGLRKVAGNLPGLNISVNSSNSSPVADITRNSRSTKFFRFPLDVEADPGLGNQGHYMMFQINEQDHAKLKFGGKGSPMRRVKAVSPVLSNLDQPPPARLDPIQQMNRYGSIQNYETAVSDYKYKSVGTKRASTTGISAHIAMYMPESVTTGYSAQYTDTEIGYITSAAIDAYEKFAQGNMRGGLEEIGRRDRDLAAALNAMMLNTAGALPGLSGLKAAAEMRSGVVLSDRMELAFKGIDKRTFQYEFKMVPKSEDEAKEIKEIVNMFKLNMLPEFAGNDVHGRSLIVPNTFNIRYMYAGAENEFLHKISECVLESMNVTYGGERYKTHSATDGGAPPIQTTMSLTFKELDLITREQVMMGM